MNHALMNWTAHAETMTATVLILMVALGKAIRSLSKRLSKSRLTLTTDSFALTMQTRPDLSRQESPPHDKGGNDNGRCNDDDRRILGTDTGDAGANASTTRIDDDDLLVIPKETQGQKEPETQEGSHRSQPAFENQKW